MEGFEFEGRADECLLGEVAIEAAYRVIKASSEPVTIAAIGPLTNVALLFKVHPDVKEKIERVVIMGGTLTRGNKGVLSEFNIATDPEAARIVFESGVQLAMVGLDIGRKALVLPDDIEEIRRSGRGGEMLYALFSHYRSGTISTGLKMYDPTAIAYLLNPEMFGTVETYVGIELTGEMTAGCTLVDLRGYLGRPANATVCTDVDQGAFRRWFVERVRACG
jgi:non-specific riboncleoside hydrolase